jgi:hypothetical protein
MDGSDEWPSLCLNRSCEKFNEKYFKCEWNGACLPEVKVCNGFDDCGDFSDERNCSSVNTTQETNFHCSFKCPKGNCLHDQQLCDRHNDCENGEDEKMCNFTLCSSTMQSCGQDANSICIVKPFNYYSCECKSGFKYDEQSKACLGSLIEINNYLIILVYSS